MNDLFEIKLIFYGPSRMLQFSQFVWPLSYSVWDVFNNFLLIDATDRSKISSDQKRFFIALILYPLSFFANSHFKYKETLWCLKTNRLYCVERERKPLGIQSTRLKEDAWRLQLANWQLSLCILIHSSFIN